MSNFFLGPNETNSVDHPMPAGNWIVTMTATAFTNSVGAKMAAGAGSVEVLNDTDTDNIKITAGGTSSIVSMPPILGSTGVTLIVSEATGPTSRTIRADANGSVVCEEVFSPGLETSVTIEHFGGELGTVIDDTVVCPTSIENGDCPPVTPCDPLP